VVIEIIPYGSFKEKMQITKKYDGKAKIEILDNRYIYVEMRQELS
jgi:hypothetical protein